MTAFQNTAGSILPLSHKTNARDGQKTSIDGNVTDLHSQTKCITLLRTLLRC